MNNYSNKAIHKLLERLEVRNYLIDGASSIVIQYYDHGKKTDIEISPSEFYICLGKNRPIENIEKYYCSNELKELMDLLFEVDFNKVPLYIGRLPEIVAWRMEMGE